MNDRVKYQLNKMHLDMENEQEPQMVTPKSWDEFRGTGLLLIVNQLLHVFGWAIAMKVEKGKTIEAYPARVKFRGFDEKSTEQAYRKVSQYMAENANELKEEAEAED